MKNFVRCSIWLIFIPITVSYICQSVEADEPKILDYVSQTLPPTPFLTNLLDSKNIGCQVTPKQPPQSFEVKLTGLPESQGTPVNIPQSFEIKLNGLPEPHGGPGWMGSVVIGALFAGIASIWTTRIAAEKRESLETHLQTERLRHDKEIKDIERKHQIDLADRQEAFSTRLKLIEHAQQNKNQQKVSSIEEQKIENEKQRLRKDTNASEIEIEIAAIRLVREQNAEAANLIHLFFDKLTDSDAKRRKLALLAISEFVDIDSIKKVLNNQNTTSPY